MCRFNRAAKRIGYDPETMQDWNIVLTLFIIQFVANAIALYLELVIFKDNYNLVFQVISVIITAVIQEFVIVWILYSFYKDLS